MAIRYTKDYNAKLQRAVRNFNKKRKTAIRNGFKNIPPIIRVSDLKARYEKRSDLERELKLLYKFSSRRGKLLEVIENEGGAKSIAWEFEHLKANEKLARDFYIRQFTIYASRAGEFPSERDKLSEMGSKLAALDMDIAYMNQDQFRAYRNAINSFLENAAKRRGGFRGFMSQALEIMKFAGIDKKDINRVMKKINELTPDQFTKMYTESDLVQRIYELADSPKYTGGRLKLLTTEENAKEITEAFVEEVDDIVEQAKKEPDFVYDPLDEFYKSVEKQKYMSPERTTSGKIKRSSLTPKQVAQLKTLGWDDLIDETQQVFCSRL